MSHSLLTCFVTAKRKDRRKAEEKTRKETRLLTCPFSLLFEDFLLSEVVSFDNSRLYSLTSDIPLRYNTLCQQAYDRTAEEPVWH